MTRSGQTLWKEEEQFILYPGDEELEPEVDSEIELLETSPVIEDELAVDDHIRLYLKEIASIPLLKASEEVELAKAIEAGKEAEARLREGVSDPTERNHLEELVENGKKARQKMVESNLRLVVSVAKRHLGRGLGLLDLIEEGNIGLMRAVEKFDYRRGYKFSTYATWWIRQRITRAIAEQSRTVRIPVHMADSLTRLYRTTQKLEQELGRPPVKDELAMAMGVSEAKIDAIIAASNYPISLETPLGEDGEMRLGDTVEDLTSPSPLEKAMANLLHEEVNWALNCLSERERLVLEMRFGLRDGHDYTLEEIGSHIGLTRERIRQIEAEALAKLRSPEIANRLREYFEEL